MARLEEKFAAHAQRQTSSGSEEKNVDQRETLADLLLSQIEPDPNQPRKELGDLEDLKASIRSVGLQQPITVRVMGYERYQLIMGERRYTASKELGLTKIRAIVRSSVAERDQLKIQVVENLHRKDLSPLEEAASYQRLMKEFDMTQEEIGEQFGKSQVSISETLKLLKLPSKIQEEYRTSDTISKSLLLEIVRQPETSTQLEMWELAKTGQLTVKQARLQKAPTRAGKKQETSPVRGVDRASTFRYPIHTDTALVTLTFEQSRASYEEIVTALEQALSQERERLEASRR